MIYTKPYSIYLRETKRVLCSVDAAQKVSTSLAEVGEAHVSHSLNS